MVDVARSIARTLRRNLPGPARHFLRSFLRNTGYEPARRQVDFRSLPLADPLLLAGARNGGRRVLVDVPLERFRILHPMGFSCAPGAPNPFVATVCGILDGSVTGYESSPLRRYYEGFTPQHVFDLYGFQHAACSEPLRERAAHAAAPWLRSPGAHMALVRRRATARDHAQVGTLAPGDDSWIDWGPVSPAKAAIEYQRLATVTASIRTHGYVPEQVGAGHMTAHLLEDGGRWVAWIRNGHHRAAALAALGHRSAPVVVLQRVFRRDEVASWPGVVCGAFTPDQALAAFDTVFSGRRPPAPGCEWWPGNGRAEPRSPSVVLAGA